MEQQLLENETRLQQVPHPPSPRKELTRIREFYAFLNKGAAPEQQLYRDLEEYSARLKGANLDSIGKFEEMVGKTIFLFHQAREKRIGKRPSLSCQMLQGFHESFGGIVSRSPVFPFKTKIGLLPLKNRR